MSRSLIFVLLALTTLAAPVAAQGPEGEWLGVLDAGTAKLRLALHVERKSDLGRDGVLRVGEGRHNPCT